MTMEDQFNDDGEIHEEFVEDDPFVGQLCNRPLPSFRVGRDLFEGYFIAIRPADGDTRPVWIARALSNPFSNPDHPNCVLIQYFRPTSRDRNVQDYYNGWDSAKGLCWRVDETQDPVWEDTNSLNMTAWKSKIKKGTLECVLKILSAQIHVINESLASYNSS